MSRNASGTYSLVSGNPVTTGTTITSSWANNTLTDIANALTDSLDRTGKGAMSAPLKLAAGSVGAPSLTYDAATTTGMYYTGVPAVIAFTVLGSHAMSIIKDGSSHYVSLSGGIRGTAPAVPTANSLYVQTSVTNGPTYFNVIPNGSGVVGAIRFWSGSDMTAGTSAMQISNGVIAGADPNSTGGIGQGIAIWPMRNSVNVVSFQADDNGDVLLGKAPLATNDTYGFVYIQTVAGDPQAGGAVPPAKATRTAIMYDNVNHKLWVNANGTWKSVALT